MIRHPEHFIRMNVKDTLANGNVVSDLLWESMENSIGFSVGGKMHRKVCFHKLWLIAFMHVWHHHDWEVGALQRLVAEIIEENYN